MIVVIGRVSEEHCTPVARALWSSCETDRLIVSHRKTHARRERQRLLAWITRRHEKYDVMVTHQHCPSQTDGRLWWRNWVEVGFRAVKLWERATGASSMFDASSRKMMIVNGDF